MMMRTGGILTCCDDGEVRDLMAFCNDQRRQMSGHLCFGSADEGDVAGLESRRDPIDGSPCRPL
jgi:hypothetical protein